MNKLPLSQMLNVNRRVVFLAEFVAMFTLQMTLSQKVINLQESLSQKPSTFLIMLSYAAIATTLVLGLAPIKQIKGVTQPKQMFYLLWGTATLLFLASISSIIIPMATMVNTF